MLHYIKVECEPCSQYVLHKTWHIEMYGNMRHKLRIVLLTKLKPIYIPIVCIRLAVNNKNGNFMDFYGN